MVQLRLIYFSQLIGCSHGAIATVIYFSQLIGCSHGAIVTAIYLPQLMGFSVTLTIALCEHLH